MMPPQEANNDQPQVSSLYVGDLHNDVTERELIEYFGGDKVVSNARVCRDAKTKRSLGYAYLNFFNRIDADDRMENLNYTVLLGKPIRINRVEKDSARRNDRKGNILIKNIDPAVDSRTVYESFKSFGPLRSFKLVTDDLGNSRGYAFLHYEKEEDADRVINSINGLKFKNKCLKVCAVIPKSERTEAKPITSNNLYVKNFYPEMSLEELLNKFRKFGALASTHFPIAPEDPNKLKGFGFICYESADAATRAMTELNQFSISDVKKLYCNFAMKKKDRAAQLYRQTQERKLQRSLENKNTNLFLKDFDESVTEQDLVEHFKQFGNIKNCKIMRNEKGTSKRFGFISFENSDMANKVIEQKSHEIKGRVIYVAKHQTKDERRDQLFKEFNKKKKSDNGVTMQPNHTMAPHLPQFYEQMVAMNPQVERQMQQFPMNSQFMHGHVMNPNAGGKPVPMQMPPHMRPMQQKPMYGRSANIPNKGRINNGVRMNNQPHMMPQEMIPQNMVPQGVVQQNRPQNYQNMQAASAVSNSIRAETTKKPQPQNPQAAENQPQSKHSAETMERVLSMAKMVNLKDHKRIVGILLSNPNIEEISKVQENLKKEVLDINKMMMEKDRSTA